MGHLIAAALGYLIGTSSMALYLSKLQKVNLRAGGSGNLGASNTMQLMGWKAGVLVALHDIGKAVLAVLLARMLFPNLPYVEAVAGVASVLGHIFPFYLKFKGGKGLASYFGMTLALDWKLALLVGAAIVIVTLVTDYIVCGTVTTVVMVPAYVGLIGHSWLLAGILAIATVVILCRHTDNYRRIWNGTEFGLRSAIRGDNRLDKKK